MAEQAELSWLDNLTPISTRFDDSYYSRENGLQETNYVFLDGNHLPARWQQKSNPVIAELGFGTGLNFLATRHAWREAQATHAVATLKTMDEDKSATQKNGPGEILTFCSFEKYPMDRDSLARALTPWAELKPIYEELLDVWQPDEEGWQHMSFSDAQLYLFIGDALQGVSCLHEKLPQLIDAWYLDGFNPKTNPELWSQELLENVVRQSNPEATFATYTAAGWVRRNLAAAGFHVEKRKGYGRKRDMCLGYKPA
ncbi:MAG: tRNA (5-methylaminomethyl-2-thiouridine)(34)-methyltransferase MnmD [Cohaesibacter sp.]|nr:tRNA (5-methylaminomethyl-2-thiouridine)(34)-methyltransferase MnmD [Cohaesibacter sp.]